MTVDEIKIFMSEPWALFFMMLMASMLSGLEQVTTAKKDGAIVSALDYLKHWPETVSVLIANIISFLLLIEINQLNTASALGIGFGLNTLIDSLRTGGRSKFLAEGKK